MPRGQTITGMRCLCTLIAVLLTYEQLLAIAVRPKARIIIGGRFHPEMRPPLGRCLWCQLGSCETGDPVGGASVGVTSIMSGSGGIFD
jgi:hypothetical protein